MLKIRLTKNDEHLFVGPTQKISITYRNPLFHKQGTASLPITLPGTNRHKLGYPHRPERPGNAPIEEGVSVTFKDQEIFNGNLVLQETTGRNYEGHLESGKGEFAAAIKGKYLTDIEYEELVSSAWIFSEDRYTDMLDYTVSYPNKPLVFFPIHMPSYEVDTGDYPYADILNAWDQGDELFRARIGGYNYQPYRVAPQFYLNFVLKKVFNHYGYQFIENDMETYATLKNLVVVNLSPLSGIKTLELRATFERDLPRILISDFITAIEELLFGKFYFNEFDRTVKFKLHKNILNHLMYNNYTVKDYTSKATDNPGISRETKKAYRFSMQHSDAIVSQNQKDYIEADGEAASLEELEGLAPDLGTINFVACMNAYYIYQYVEESESNEWVLYSHNLQDYIHNDGQDQEESISPKCGTLGMTRIEGGRYDFEHSLTESSFYIPRSDNEMELFPKFDPKREDKLNLLFYNGMKDFVGVFPGTWQYPSASNLSAYNTYGLNWNGSNGLVKILGKEYLTWLDNIKLELSWLINFSGSDIRSLDFTKKIRIKNQEYLISFVKVDYSLDKMEVKEVGVVRC